MKKEEDEVGAEAVATKATDQDATPNANAPTTTRPARLQTLLPTQTHINRGQFELLSLPPIPNTAPDGKTTPPRPLSPPWVAGYTNGPPLPLPPPQTAIHRYGPHNKKRPPIDSTVHYTASTSPTMA